MDHQKASNSMGFKQSGVAKGSVAASVQSSLGNVPVGSAFSRLQSNAAKGSTPSKGHTSAKGGSSKGHTSKGGGSRKR